MEYMIYVTMFAILGYVVYRNFLVISRYRHNKEYIEAYKEMLEGKESAYDRVCHYVDNETAEEYKNKGRVLKLYLELDKGLDYEQTLRQTDLKEIFYRKGRFSKEMMNMNSDIFVWIFIVMAKARQLSKLDVLNGLYDQFKGMEDELGDRLEVAQVKALYDSLCEQEDGGVAFLSDLLQGNYTGYTYDRHLIGLYKRFAAATLAYGGEPLEDYYQDDLHHFAATLVGKTYMEALEIYDKFPPLNKEAEEGEAKEG